MSKRGIKKIFYFVKSIKNNSNFLKSGKLSGGSSNQVLTSTDTKNYKWDSYPSEVPKGGKKGQKLFNKGDNKGFKFGDLVAGFAIPDHMVVYYDHNADRIHKLFKDRYGSATWHSLNSGAPYEPSQGTKSICVYLVGAGGITSSNIAMSGGGTAIFYLNIKENSTYRVGIGSRNNGTYFSEDGNIIAKAMDGSNDKDKRYGGDSHIYSPAIGIPLEGTERYDGNSGALGGQSGGGLAPPQSQYTSSSLDSAWPGAGLDHRGDGFGRGYAGIYIYEYRSTSNLYVPRNNKVKKLNYKEGQKYACIMNTNTILYSIPSVIDYDPGNDTTYIECPNECEQGWFYHNEDKVFLPPTKYDSELYDYDKKEKKLVLNKERKIKFDKKNIINKYNEMFLELKSSFKASKILNSGNVKTIQSTYKDLLESFKKEMREVGKYV